MARFRLIVYRHVTNCFTSYLYSPATRGNVPRASTITGAPITWQAPVIYTQRWPPPSFRTTGMEIGAPLILPRTIIFHVSYRRVALFHKLVRCLARVTCPTMLNTCAHNDARCSIGSNCMYRLTGPRREREGSRGRRDTVPSIY